MTVDPGQVRRAVAAAGFTVGDFVQPDGLPEPTAMWKPIIALAAEPTAKVADDLVAPTWLRLARANGTIGPDGSLLVSIGGAAALPWLAVRVGTEDPDVGELSLDGQDPEFVAISVDGRARCAVTSEEYGAWIFADPPRAPGEESP